MAEKMQLNKRRIHYEGTATISIVGSSLLILNALSFYFLYSDYALICYLIAFISIVLFGIILNFFRCPIRIFPHPTKNVIVAPADGKVVVVEEVEENEYFKDHRIMVSIFMSVVNVHANWFPCEGIVKMVKHHKGNFHKAWLPKASIENERSTVVIETPDGQEVLVRQVAGALARRIVTYAQPNGTCFIDQHLGFIKFGSRVDVYLPLNTDIKVTVGELTSGNQTILAQLISKDV